MVHDKRYAIQGLKAILGYTVVFLFFASIALSQNPNGYYNSTYGKVKEDLKTELHNIIKNHTILSYSSLWTVFQYTDALPNNKVWDMYSNIERFYPNTSGLNREHSFPVSWWGGSTSVASYTDINHIFPSDATANNAKSNYPLGIVGGNPTFDNGVSKVGNNNYPGYTGRVFEPSNEYKGDFARAYFYMVTCYQDYYNMWNPNYMYMLESNTYPTLKPWAVNLLLEWHRNDPVSEKELNRNEEVFIRQNNRNPFIDYPELVEHIWGNKMDIAFTLSLETNPVLATPTNETKLEFGTIETGKSLELELYIKGNNLSGSGLYFDLVGTNANQFSINTDFISTTTANAGYFLKVTYKPTVISNSHTAAIFIEGGNFPGSVKVNISGNSIAPITPPVALPATNITSTGFRANWQSDGTTNYVLELYSFENEIKTFIDDYENIQTNFYDVSGLQSGKTYIYVVRKWAQGVLSDPSQEITVITTVSIHNTTQIEEIYFYSQNKKIYFQNKSNQNQTVEIYDVLGRLIKRIELISGENIVEITVSGIYFIKNRSEVRKVIVE